MKKSEIALAIILILITAYIFITVFVGWGAFGFGRGLNPNASPPSPNATLFEKAEWEEHHGSICQCSPAFELKGPIQLFPVSDYGISKVSFNVSLSPGMIPVEMKNTSFTISTKNIEKTVRYTDPAVKLMWIMENGTVMSKQDYPLIRPFYRGTVFVELDLQKMGFSSTGLCPEERFSLIITPPSGYHYAITRATPYEFSQGVPIEIRGWP